MPQTTLDPQLVNLAKALRQTESNGNFQAKGASGEYGAYQFLPTTWAAKAAAAGIKTPLEKASPQEQNEVAYKTLATWKQQHPDWNVGNFASAWNAGEGAPNAYKENHVGTNSQGVSYDTPGYAKKVAEAYQQFKGQQSPSTTGGFNPTPFSGAASGGSPVIDFSGANQQPPTQTTQSDGSFLGDAENTVGQAGTGVANAAKDTISGKINPLSGLIQGVGAIAGGVGGLTNNVLEHAPVVGGLYKGAEGLIGQGVNAAAQTAPGKAVSQGIQGFQQAHPELSGDIGAGINIASAIPILKGLGLAKGLVKGAVGGALHGGEDAALETLSPKLSAGERAKAVMNQGTSQKGLLRKTVLNPKAADKEVKDAVVKNVPGFNPTKNTLTQNIEAVRGTVNKLKTSLKEDVATEGAGKIYPVKQLMSRLRAIPTPDLIASDTTLNNVYGRLLKRVQGIAEEQGGKVENLPNILSDFDKAVKEQYGDIYKSDKLSPLKKGVRDIREEIKTFAEEQMPTVALKQKMLTIHHLLTGMENMSERATSGAANEIGSTAISRLASRHPHIRGLVKTGVRLGVEGSGLGAAMHFLGE